MSEQSQTLVWDCSGLLHAARAERLDVLAKHAKGTPSRPWTSLTTGYVEDELSDYGFNVPDWVAVEPETLAEQATLPDWIERMGAGPRDMGEATVCNLAAGRGATAILDDSDARAVAMTYGLEVHGVLWVIAAPVRTGSCTEVTASNLADQLLDTGARFPFQRGQFVVWARRHGLFT